MSRARPSESPRPLRVVVADLARGLADLAPVAGDDRDVFAVLTWRGRPLGDARFSARQLAEPAGLPPLVAEAVAGGVDALLDELPAPARPAPELLAGLAAGDPDSGPQTTLRTALDAALGEPPAGPLPLSVIVCTRDRPDDLATCLSSLAALSVGVDEVVVVDNAADGAATRAVVKRFPGVRYVHEPRAGLSRARNAGLRAVRNELVAFTDDDAVVAPDWAWRLYQAFADPRVMAVTGLVLPVELDTPAQVAFELHMGGFGRGYRPRTYGPELLAELGGRGAPVWRIGAGANMALRRSALDAVGLYDERLGAGATGCSEDSELWYRLLAAGWTCQYTPAAVVWHRHRRDAAGLRRQAHDYMRGHVAALFVQFARHRHVGNLLRALVLLPRHYLVRAVAELPQARRPTSTFLPEVAGYLRGLALWRMASRKALAPAGVRSSRRAFLRRNPYPHPYTDGLFYREKMRAIHRIAPPGPVRSVLEVGGGQSGLTAMLYPGARVTSIDLEGDFARALPNRGPHQQFVTADATRLPFADGSFDAVTMFDVLEHIPDDAAAAAEARRVLRPGGFVLVTSPNERWRFPYYRLLQRWVPSDQEMMRRWGHVRRGYADADLQALFGTPPAARATFINPLSVLAHDLGFSTLRRTPRRLAQALVAPLAWLGYALAAPEGPGTETATRWPARPVQPRQGSRPGEPPTSAQAS